MTTEEAKDVKEQIAKKEREIEARLADEARKKAEEEKAVAADIQARIQRDAAAQEARRGRRGGKRRGGGERRRSARRWRPSIRRSLRRRAVREQWRYNESVCRCMILRKTTSARHDARVARHVARDWTGRRHDARSEQRRRAGGLLHDGL